MDNDKTNGPDEGIIGTPTWEVVNEPGIKCPNCEAKLAFVKVPIKHKLLAGSVGKANYMSCPACGWQSPAVMVSEGKSAQP